MLCGGSLRGKVHASHGEVHVFHVGAWWDDVLEVLVDT